MMKKTLKFSLKTFCLMGFINLWMGFEGWAQRNLYYEISNVFQQRAKEVSCQSLKSMIQDLEQLHDDMKEYDEERVMNKLTALYAGLEPSVLRKKVPLKQLHKDFKQVFMNQKKKPFNKVLRSFCRMILKPSVLGIQTLALLNSSAVHLSYTPLGSVIQFLNGVFSLQRKDLSRFNDDVFRILGPKSKGLKFVVTNVVGQLISSVIKAPHLALFHLPLATELLTNYTCFEQEKPNRFCQDYQKIRTFFGQPLKKSYLLGQKLQHRYYQKLIQRKKSPIRFCELSPKKQVKKIKRILAHHGEFIAQPEVKGVNVLLPVHKNSCSRIFILTKKKEDVKKLQDIKKMMEGVEIVYSHEEDILTQYYFSLDELKKMDPVDSYCYEAEFLFFDVLLKRQAKELLDLTKALTAEAVLANPLIQEITVNDQNLFQAHETAKFKNGIFTFSLNENEKSIAQSLKKERDFLLKKVKKSYKKTFKMGNYQKCRAFFDQRSLSSKVLIQNIERINEIEQDPLFKTYQESMVVKKIFSKLSHQLKLSWDFVEAQDLTTILKALQSSQWRNVLIISHARSSGHLIHENNGQKIEYPSETFAFHSASLQSINFYSCYGKKSSNIYQVEKALKTSSSYHKIRYHSVVNENDFMDSSQFAPLSAFGHYLKKLDRKLYLAARGSLLMQEKWGKELPQKPTTPWCFLDDRALKVQSGEYGVILNGKLLKTLKASSFDEKRPDQRLSFPCSLLKENNNTLTLKSLTYQQSSSLALDQLSLVLQTESQSWTISPRYAFESFVLYKF